MVSYDGTEWTQGRGSFTSTDVVDIWVNSSNDAIAVGRGGLILHYDGSTWQQKPSGATGSLFGIWSNGIVAYAVGAHRTALKYEGGVWMQLPEPSYIGLSAIFCVWGFDNNDVYFGGSRNVIHWNGSSWNNITPPGIENSVHDMWGQSPYLFCAVGYYETWHYDGSNWIQYWLPTSSTVTSVWGFAPDDVYAVAHRLMHFNGTAWSDLSGYMPQYLLDVWGPAPDRLFVVGSSASFLWNGSSMEAFSTPVIGYLNAVSGTSECSIFTVGDDGCVLYAGDSLIVSVEASQQPAKITLMQNYPNPFHPNTVIGFSLDCSENVTLTVYDVGGRLIRTLIDGNVAPGGMSITWDGTDTRGNSASSGVYFYRLKAGNRTFTKKMVLLK
jgi:hypothetical protein